MVAHTVLGLNGFFCLFVYFFNLGVSETSEGEYFDAVLLQPTRDIITATGPPLSLMW